MDKVPPRVVKRDQRNGPPVPSVDSEENRESALVKEINEAHALVGRLEQKFLAIRQLMPSRAG